MPVPIRAVVFDLDGLMFDTEALFFRVSSDMLAGAGQAVQSRDHASYDRPPLGGRGPRPEDHDRPR